MKLIQSNVVVKPSDGTDTLFLSLYVYESLSLSIYINTLILHFSTLVFLDHNGIITHPHILQLWWKSNAAAAMQDCGMLSCDT